MTRLRGKELSKLYPYPKSYDTLQAERNRRLQSRQPRLVSVKISVSSAILLSVVLVSYQLIYNVIKENLSWYGEVIAGLSLSALIISFAIALMFFFYSVIKELAIQVFGSTTEVFTTLVIVWFFSAAILILLGKLQISNPLSTVILLAFTVTASFVAIEFRKQRAKL